jgi:hypothetical protein
MTRVQESLIYGAIYKEADTEIAGVTMYPPELEPDVTSQDDWAQIQIELDDVPMHSGEWSGAGKMKVFIGARKTGGNIYAAKTVAHSFSTTFAKQTVTVKNNAGTTVGWVRFYDAMSRPLGEADGIINQYWEIPFYVYSA